MLFLIQNCSLGYTHGIRGTVLTWLKHFFSGRMHQTRVENVSSNIVTLYSGVVQGSGIGPLMFSVYISELIDVLETQCQSQDVR